MDLATIYEAIKNSTISIVIMMVELFILQGLRNKEKYDTLDFVLVIIITVNILLQMIILAIRFS